MAEPKVNEIKKYISAMEKMKKKYITVDRLSHVIGYYPDVIYQVLSYFEPMLSMDPEYNLLELVPTLKQYVVDKEEEKNVNVIRKPAIKKNDWEQFDSVSDFIYKRMTFTGGLLDRNVVLSDKDLRILKKLITEEQQARKNHKK